MFLICPWEKYTMEMGGDEQLLAAYPFYFGVSCAFVALDLVSRKRRELLDVNGGGGSRLAEMMLKGSAQLLGLLVERAQARGEAMEKKLKKAHSELEEMKRRRTEDAKANEKVVAIFSAHEQRWIAERKSLRLQIHALANELRIAKSNYSDAISTLERTIEEGEQARMLKDEAMEAEARKLKDSEEKLQLADEVLDEMAERAKKAAQDHSAEVWKHKTAFVELVLSQRQMEAEMNLTLRQAEAARQELEEALERKEEAFAMVDKLSQQIVRMQKDSEQKDQVLSAMLRKLKLDTTEKQMLVKEVKISKAKKKQAELEMERWRNMWESSRNKNSRNMHSGHNSINRFPESDDREEESSTTTALKCHGHLSIDENGEAALAMEEQLQDWVRKETENYATILEQKHYAEIEAFTEQLRQKDEKSAALGWKVVSMELETKRLRSHIKGLDGELSRSRVENAKLEAMLLDDEKKIKQQFHLHVQNSQRSHSNCFPIPDTCHALWSEVSKDKQKQKTEDSSAKLIDEAVEMDAGNDTDQERKNVDTEINKSDAAEPPSPSNNSSWEYSDGCSEMPSANKLSLTKTSLVKDTCLKMDIQALGVSYKIKRLKQQLVMLEKLASSLALMQITNKDESYEEIDENKQQTNALLLVQSLLNKQLKRYQSLEEKTDNLCSRMKERCRSGGSRDLQNGRTMEQVEMLGHFLEETFQLQRYIVATGQKLMEMLSRMDSTLNGATRFDESVGFNIKLFADIVRTLFREIQQGLEVRIARIIGDLEGTLACDGILQR